MPKQRNQKNRNNKKNVNIKPGKNFSRILGTKDVTVKDFDNWEIVKNNITDFLHRYGFKQIETPILEKAELFKSSFRNNDPKEFYSFISDKKEKVVLRPELTQGILRAYQEYNLEEEMPHPVRLFSVGPVFRQEKLQNGRYRQFNQVNAEVIGEDKPVSEVLLMVTAYNMFKDLGLNVEVQINSLGDKDCQKEYKNKLTAFYKERGKRSKLCNSCKKLLEKDPLALLDCKEKECMEIRKDAPQIADFLSEDSREHFSKVVEYLDELDIRYNFDPYLVRGLSYYNDTVFEIWPLDEKENAQFRYSLGGGGRYDNLVEKLGNKATPAVGMAIGLERALTKIKEQGLILFPKPYNLIFIAQISEQAKIKSLQIFEELRKEGYNVRHSFATNSLKTQLEEAKELDARLSLIIGKKELNDDTILLRDMDSGVQEIIPQKKIKSDINKKLK
ncbi:histidine--tRNA ligase [Patescibacteria group bacterium]|nr:histidine--tRNA ligase [Patescibacteria group bacterium]